MRIKKMKWNKKGRPKTITVELSLNEAGYLALLTGRNSWDSNREFYPAYAGEGSEIYDCLSGEIFNTHWDDGVNGWLNGDSLSNGGL